MLASRIAPAVALVALVVGTARSQEKIDNPQYTSWAKFKPGTTVVLKSTTSAGEIKSESTITTKLVEVGSDKLVLEVSLNATVNGMEVKNPPMKQDVLKQITLPAGVKKPPALGEKPEGTIEEGTETLKIGGTEVKTKWYKTKNTIEGSTTEAKTWISDDVPGTLVKMEANTTGKVTVMVKMEVTEFKKP